MPADLVLVSELDYAPERPTNTFMEFYSKPFRLLNLPRLPHPQQLGVVALGTYLRQKGIEVQIFDNVVRMPGPRQALFQALDQQPPAVGISTSLLINPESVRCLADWIRERCPRTCLILGGAGAAFIPEMRQFADIVVLGDGEQTALELIQALGRRSSLENIPNLLIRRGDNWLGTPRRSNISVDEIPPPDWDLLATRASRCHGIEASKGCRYNCVFCTYEGRADQRMKSIDLVAAEIRRNHDLYGIDLYRFADANLTSWPEQTEALCEAIISLGIPIRWGCYARLDNFARRPGLAQKMRSAGCVAVYSGIESGSDFILRKMRKGYNVSHLREGMRWLKEENIHAHGNFIIGFPGETRSTVDEMLALIDELALDTVSFFSLAVAPYSDMWDLKASYGLEGSNIRWRHATMDSDEAQSLVDYSTETVCMKMSHPLIGDEHRMVYNYLGNGLSLSQGRECMRAFRDFYRSQCLADTRLGQESLGRIKSYYDLILEDLKTRVKDIQSASPEEV